MERHKQTELLLNKSGELFELVNKLDDEVCSRDYEDLNDKVEMFHSILTYPFKDLDAALDHQIKLCTNLLIQNLQSDLFAAKERVKFLEALLKNKEV